MLANRLMVAEGNSHPRQEDPGPLDGPDPLPPGHYVPVRNRGPLFVREVTGPPEVAEHVVECDSAAQDLPGGHCRIEAARINFETPPTELPIYAHAKYGDDPTTS